MRRLLIVDDDNGVRLVLSHCLEHMGFAVTTVANGIDALKALEGGNFDAVVMDINMPPITGIETCARMMNRKSPTQPPVWLMTGMWCDEVERRGIAVGARAVLSKPFNCEHLVKQLEAGGLRAA